MDMKKKNLAALALCAACKNKTTDKIIYVAAGTNADAVARLAAEFREKGTEADKTLIATVKKDDTAALKHLIKAGADVNAAGDRGQTALTMAAFGNRADITEVLLKAGADVNAKNEDGKTALMRAAENNAIDVARLLIEAGADVNAKDEDGKTALMYAEECEVADVIALLKAAGAKN